MSHAPQDADEERTTVIIRRAPKFSAFVAVGALIGFIATLILTSMFPSDPEVGFAASLGFFSLIGISFGAVIAAAIAIAVDRRATRRGTKVIAGKLAVHVDDEFSLADDSSSENQE